MIIDNCRTVIAPFCPFSPYLFPTAARLFFLWFPHTVVRIPVFQLEDKTLFHDEFVHYLKYAMIVYKREPAVENVIEFVAKFATSFQSPSKNEEEDEENEEDEDEVEDDHPFLSFIFNFLLEVWAKINTISTLGSNKTKLYIHIFDSFFFLILHLCVESLMTQIWLATFATSLLLFLPFTYSHPAVSLRHFLPVSQSQQPRCAFSRVPTDQQIAGQYGRERPDWRWPLRSDSPSHAGSGQWQISQCEDSGCVGHDASATASGARLSHHQWFVFVFFFKGSKYMK